eukprot:4583342-Alexandrium_andersonii.AAC.1
MQGPKPKANLAAPAARVMDDGTVFRFRCPGSCGTTHLATCKQVQSRGGWQQWWCQACGVHLRVGR